MSATRKKLKVLFAVLFSVGLMVATIPAAIWLTHTQTAQIGNDELRCRSLHQTAHIVVIEHDEVVPKHTKASRCDSLTIINRDAKTRLVGFGPHDHHISYDGISQRLLEHNKNLTITLIKTGTYNFHDHADDEIQGSFTVR